MKRVVLSFLFLVVVLAHPALSADLEVTTTVDENDHSCTDGDCSLRDAAEVALADDNIILQADTYTLTLGQIRIAGDGVSLSGAGTASTTVQAADSPGTAFHRVFEIDGIVTISDLTIRHGRVVSVHEDPFVYGGGISNSGTLTLRRCNITDNQVIGFNNALGDGGQALGGGIYNKGTLVLEDCIVSRNHPIGGSGSSSSTGGRASGGGIGSEGSTVTITDTIIEDNLAEGGSANTGGPAQGGGIFSLTETQSFSLTLDRCTVRNNKARSGPGTFSAFAAGGGILQRTFSSGGTPIDSTLTFVSSTISGNTAESHDALSGGGGLSQTATQLQGAAGAHATVTLLNCTVSGNISSAGPDYGGRGGGIDNLAFPPASGADVSATVTLGNTTVASNSASGPNSLAGGLYNHSTAGSAVNFRNSIIAGNSAAGGPDCFGTLTSQGYSLIQNQATDFCTLAGSLTGNITGQDPLLGPLQDNGGTTQTRALDPDSPTVDKGNPAPPGSGGSACEGLDQRGSIRPLDGPDVDSVAVCDMGAYELVAPQPTVTATPTQTATVTPTPTGPTPTSSPTPALTTASPRGSFSPALMLLLTGILLVASRGGTSRGTISGKSCPPAAERSSGRPASRAHATSDAKS